MDIGPLQEEEGERPNLPRDLKKRPTEWKGRRRTTDEGSDGLFPAMAGKSKEATSF